MAKLEQVLNGDFGQMLDRIERGILNGSMSASLNDFLYIQSNRSIILTNKAKLCTIKRKLIFVK